MESRKMVLMHLFAGQQWRHKPENRLMDQGVEAEGEREMNGESRMEVYTLPYIKQIGNGNFLYDSGNSNWGSIQPRGVRKSGRWGVGSRGRGHMYTYG